MGRKYKQILISVLLFFCFSWLSYASSQMVYVEPGGTVYHKKDCMHLGKGCTAMTLKYAEAEGYKPCLSVFQKKNLPQKTPKPVIFRRNVLKKTEAQAETPGLLEETPITSICPGFRETKWEMTKTQVIKGNGLDNRATSTFL